MKKLLEIANKYGVLITTILVIILFFRTCGMNVKERNFENNVKNYYSKLDSSINNFSKKIYIVNERAIIERKIEGLRNEKRMIQATDRKIVDYNRENDIEKEIKNLEKELQAYGN